VAASADTAGAPPLQSAVGTPTAGGPIAEGPGQRSRRRRRRRGRRGGGSAAALMGAPGAAPGSATDTPLESSGAAESNEPFDDGGDGGAEESRSGEAANGSDAPQDTGHAPPTVPGPGDAEPQ